MPIEELDEKADTAFKNPLLFLSSPENPQNIFPGILLLFLFSLGNQPFF